MPWRNVTWRVACGVCGVGVGGGVDLLGVGTDNGQSRHA